MYDPQTTIKQKLPYDIKVTLFDKVQITNTRGQVLVVSRDEITRILNRDDLDAHRRKMYEAAKEALRKANR
jgi:CBS-domain-containing membrane protein